MTCQNQAFVAEISCRVLMLLRKQMNLALICYIIYVSMIYQSKVMLIRRSCSINLYKITEPRKQKLKVEILHDLKEFLKEFLI